MKLHTRETYEEVIERLIENLSELDEKTRAEIEEARKAIETGKFVTHEQLKKVSWPLMEYKVVWSISAARELKNLDRSIAKRIYEKVNALFHNPERYVEKLIRYLYYRLRIGDYRVILDIEHESVRILILKVGHGSTVYER